MLTEYSKTYHPTYHNLVEVTKKHERAHWVEAEVKLQSDVEQWQTGKITKEEKALVTNILRLFTQADVNVGQGYYDKLIPIIKNNEARNMLGSFACREGTHQRAYALLNDTLGFSEDFYDEFLSYKEMKDKHEFMIEDIGKGYGDFAKYLAKQTLVEGVVLFASFAILLNFDRTGKLAGMCDVVRWSQIDESLHIEGNTELFRLFCEEHPRVVTEDFKREIYQCARDTVELEDHFLDLVFSLGGTENLEKEDVKQYVRYVTDYRLQQMGLKPNWGVKGNPLPWIDYLMGDTFGNFFEREVVEYSKGNTTGNWEDGYPAKNVMSFLFND
ncbi:ribonucleotide reductase small chain [Vibrio phage 1.084.O._10N.261.49.F5]|nr:ribonucleotide reductase small chain [Vibrio phage 1.084.O._10N.261.49.F5]